MFFLNIRMLPVNLKLSRLSVAILGLAMIATIANGQQLDRLQGGYSDADPGSENQVNWASFMKSNDLVYDTLTADWTDGLFMGNGLLGNTVFMKDPQRLRVDVGRTDVRDHRQGNSLGALFNKARLPIGYFTLRPQGKISQNTARLNLWAAEGTGRLKTDRGLIYWRSWTAADRNLIVFQLKASPGEQEARWNFHPAASVSPRLKFHPALQAQYKGNPEASKSSMAGVDYCFQPLISGGGYSTAWQEIKTTEDTLGFIEQAYADADSYPAHEADKHCWTTRTFYISIGYSQDRKEKSIEEAVSEVKAAKGIALKEQLLAHRSWWHDFYKKSFISVPDATLNSFYWIQMYKLASASRKGKPMIDLMGPWMASTPWPGNWWNLNTELTYSPLYTANHLGIASQLGVTIDKNIENLRANVPAPFRYNSIGLGRAGAPDMIAEVKVTGTASDMDKPYENMELGDLTWNLYYYWLQYRYSMDPAVLKRFFPVLKENINYYLHLAKKGTDGLYHLPYSYSPEYPKGFTRDANYALSLFKWGCQTLIESNKLLNAKDALDSKWKDIVKHLTPFPKDDNGLRIGKDVAFKVSHRHYSHLLMIYPLHLMTWADSADRGLITRSLHHWHSLPGALQGYSFTGGASIYALMRKGKEALAYLKTLIHDFIKVNTMYMESGPVIETPLAAATSMQELLLQSYGGVIRVFPAVPDSWADASFDHLRTEGALLVSAVRSKSKTRWVRIKATVDGEYRLQPGLDRDEAVLLKSIKGTSSTSDLKKVTAQAGRSIYQISLKKGDEVLLFTDKYDLGFPLSAVAFNAAGEQNYFGKKKRTVL